MKKIFFIILCICSIVACSKVKTKDFPKSNEMLSQFHQLLVEDSVPLYNHFLIHSDQRVDAMDSSFRISALAGFSDSPTFNNASVNSVVVNTRSLTKEADSAFNFLYGGATLSEGVSLAGTNVKVKIIGNNPADSLTKFIYVPKHIKKTVKGFPLGELSTLDDLTLTWQPDSLSQFQNVAIKISYYSGLSLSSDPTLPEGVNPVSLLVPDNGSYTIPKATLQAFPDRGYVGISLGRATEVEGNLPITQRRVFYWGVSSVSTPPLYLIESVNVSGLNNKTSSFNVRFVNTSSQKDYTFLLAHNTLLHLLGKVPVGKYTVFFTPAGTTQRCTFGVNGVTKTGTLAAFTNVIISANSSVTVN